jgi:3-deoxy-D-manno-octulosonic-acid transferase
LRRQKYASGFTERLGTYPGFKQDGRKVIWLHCVSVGEANAARSLVDVLIRSLPDHRLVISTTTKTGNDLAKQIFSGKADAIFYFPFDWKFSVRHALKTFQPSLILLMETEIWPRLITEAKRHGAKVAIVSGRLSQKSFERYSMVGSFVRSILRRLDLALMQSDADAERIVSLVLDKPKVITTGNLKFDLSISTDEAVLTENLKTRFRFDGSRPLIVAASTHDPEERLILTSLKERLAHDARLLIAPRHPERFDAVAEILEGSGHRFVRRSNEPSDSDRSADIVLLDSVGELRAVFPLAEIVFVGGSLIPHGGQSILEPASAGKAIITGPFTHNFSDALKTFLADDAVIQLPEMQSENEFVEALSQQFDRLLHDRKKRDELGANALHVMKANRGATSNTISELVKLMGAE